MSDPQRHGPALALLRQKGPTFRRGALGEFDTGERKFLCLSSNAQAYIARYFPTGITDRLSLQNSTGGSLAGLPYMMVVDADWQQRDGDEAIITVRYEGVLDARKEAAVIVTTNIEQQSITPYNEGSAVYIPTKLNVPKPVVVHKWTTVRGRPNQLATGAEKKPPGITTAETARLARYYDDFTGDEIAIFEGWVHVSRDARSPANVLKSQTWKVEDRYEFTIIRIPA